MYRKGMRGFGGFDATTLDPSIILMGLNQADHTNPQVGVFPVQAALVEIGAMSPLIPGTNKSSVDGIWGKLTQASYQSATGSDTVDRKSLAVLAQKVVEKQSGGKVPPPQPGQQQGGGGSAWGSPCAPGTIGPFQPLCVPQGSVPPGIVPGGYSPPPGPAVYEQAQQDNTMLYVGIGAGALVLLGAVFFLTRKKPAQQAVSNPARKKSKKKSKKTKKRKSKRMSTIVIPRWLEIADKPLPKRSRRKKR